MVFHKTDSVWVNIKASITAVNVFYPSSALFPREEVGVLIEKNVKPGISGKHNLDIVVFPYLWGRLSCVWSLSGRIGCPWRWVTDLDGKPCLICCGSSYIPLCCWELQFNFTSLSSLFCCCLFLRIALGNWYFILLCVIGHVGSQYLPEMDLTILNLIKNVYEHVIITRLRKALVFPFIQFLKNNFDSMWSSIISKKSLLTNTQLLTSEHCHLLFIVVYT